jgi:hypothetical protein
MNEDWRLTETQVSAARKMHAKLKNWRFADRAFEFLKQRHFENKEVCLLMVVAVDALYSTNLRYIPGRREEIARYVYQIRERLLEPAEVTPRLVEDIARHGSKTASISFASKFCHFFVSADYPIYDRFVCAALEEIISPQERREMGIKIDRYSDFSEICRWMTVLKGPTHCVIPMRELDQCLWLMGQYLGFPRNNLDGAMNSQNEVRVLFEDDPDSFHKLLPDR